MAEYPIHHDHGTVALLPYTTIATFPIGSFLENITVRPDGTLLVSSMIAGDIQYLEPHAPNPQSTILTVHSFNPESASSESNQANTGLHNIASALVEDPLIPDIFYAFSGEQGVPGTWAVFKLDLRDFTPSSANPIVKIEKVAEVPQAQWLNGATMLPAHHTLLTADPLQGQLISCHIPTGKIEMWLEDPLLRRITTRPPWPCVTGVQFFRGYVFVTNSDRALVLRAKVDEEAGGYERDTLEVVVRDLTGDDLAFDVEGNAYVTTSVAQTVAKLGGVGMKGTVGGRGEERVTILGGEDKTETAGPTAVAFGRTEKDAESLYILSAGGIISPVDGGALGLARVVRVGVGVRGE